MFPKALPALPRLRRDIALILVLPTLVLLLPFHFNKHALTALERLRPESRFPAVYENHVQYTEIVPAYRTNSASINNSANLKLVGRPPAYWAANSRLAHPILEFLNANFYL